MPDGTSPPRSPRRAVERLSKLGVDVVIVTSADAAEVDRRLRARPDGPGQLYLAGAADLADSMRWALTRLAERGIGSGLVLIAGSQFGIPGADRALLVPEADRAGVVSVGPEPAGVRPACCTGRAARTPSSRSSAS